MSGTGRGVLIGVLGSSERATVLPDGGVALTGGDVLRWAVVAEDRVHHPADEPTRRQRCVDGTPVVETSVRVPGGDVVVSAYAVTDGGGSVVLDVENRAGTSVAFACNRADVVTARPTLAPPVGGDLGAGWRTLPLAHGSRLRVALPFVAGRVDGSELAVMASGEQVARGWTMQSSFGLRADLPDPSLTEGLVRARCQSVLAPVPDPDREPERFLLLAGQRAQRRLLTGIFADDVGSAATRLARQVRKAERSPWTAAAALGAAARVLHALGDDRAARDAIALADRLPEAEVAPDDAPTDDVLFEPWLTRRLAASHGSTVDVLPRCPRSWWGANFSAYEVPTLAGPVGFAVRWHGARPALLWEAPLGTVVRCPGLDPMWSATEPEGEALLATPV